MTASSESSSSAADLLPAFVRTGVPLIVGPLVAHFGFDVNDPGTAVLVSSLVAYVYYVLVRALERYSPALGYLLGIAKTPTYLAPPAVVIDQDGRRVVGNDDGSVDGSAGHPQ